MFDMRLVVFLISVLACCPIAAQSVFVDSLTEVNVVFPENVKIVETNQEAFRKCTVNTSNSTISVFSKKWNKRKNELSWEEINSFDENDKYGKYIEDEAIDKYGVQGWFRCYETADKNYKPIYNFVTVIKGYNYVEYFVETSYSKEDLMSREILKNSVFPYKKITPYVIWCDLHQPFKLYFFIIFGVIGIILFFIKKWIPKAIRIILFILCIPAGSLYLASFYWTIAIYYMLIYGCIWAACLFWANSWNDVMNMLNTVNDNV